MRFILGVCVFLKPTCSVWSDDSFAQNIPSLAFMRSACPSCFSTHAPRPRPSFLSGIFGLWSNGAGIRIVCRAAPHAAFGRTDVAEGGVRGPRPRLYLSSNALQREWCTSGGYRGLADPSVYMLRMLPRGECLPVREGVKPSRRRAQTVRVSTDCKLSAAASVKNTHPHSRHTFRCCRTFSRACVSALVSELVAYSVHKVLEWRR